jgi:hypothetical protein
VAALTTTVGTTAAGVAALTTTDGAVAPLYSNPVAVEPANGWKRRAVLPCTNPVEVAWASEWRRKVGDRLRAAPS